MSHDSSYAFYQLPSALVNGRVPV